MVKPLKDEHLGSADVGTILLLYRGCPLKKVKLYWHDPLRTTELVLYRKAKCIVSFKKVTAEILYVHTYARNVQHHIIHVEV